MKNYFKIKPHTKSVTLLIISVAWFFVVAKPLLYNYPYLTLVTSLLSLYAAFLGLQNIRDSRYPILQYISILLGLIISLISYGILLLELSPI